MSGGLPDPWTELRRLTSARIALGRAGSGQRTPVHLAFQLAHARARDAVHHAADLGVIGAGLEAEGAAVCQVTSAAPDRTRYLQRPDLGRQLGDGMAERITALAHPEGSDLAIVIADGLSGQAVEAHAAGVALGLRRMLGAEGWHLAPIVLVQQGRVAIGDAIGAALGARLILMLIGERPGLSSPDSLGAYLTWQPRPGRTDAERNCVSNIRPDGLPPATAVERIGWLLRESRRRGVSGISLKEEMAAPTLGAAQDDGIAARRLAPE